MAVMRVSVSLLLLLVHQSFSLNILSTLQQGVSNLNFLISREVVDAVNPIAQGVTYLASSQCELLKKILQLDYNSTEGDRAPDVDDLPLVYTTKDIQVSFPLRAASTELPRILGQNASTVVLKIFAHGFTDNPSKGNFQAVNDAYRSMGVDGILALDASSMIAYCYSCSTTNVHHIGNGLGEALAALFDVGLLPENIHLVGHSLGAHICGFAAKRFTELTGRKVARVTGLDPAGPCFAEVDDDLRLKSSDADFVDVIHSNAGVFGISTSIGHVEIYPNGGSVQPECGEETCSHSFAVKLFVESILAPTSFPVVGCNSYANFTKGIVEERYNLMGEGAVPQFPGKYCVQTNGKSPYARGEAGVIYDNNKGLVRTIQNSLIDLVSSLHN